jgi:hypothetical protein
MLWSLLAETDELLGGMIMIPSRFVWSQRLPIEAMLLADTGPAQASNLRIRW